MTDLTELWDKGKLPEGDYYIKRRNGYLPYDNIDSHGIWRNTIDEDIIEVLAPVPSYDELEKLKELLKECESSIQYYQEAYGAMDLDTYTLLAKLKEVL